MKPHAGQKPSRRSPVGKPAASSSVSSSRQELVGMPACSKKTSISACPQAGQAADGVAPLRRGHEPTTSGVGTGTMKRPPASA